MADRTKIEWTDATWNPIVGCSVLSPGCTNCYAMRLAGTRLRHHPSRAGLTQPSKAGPVWTGETRLDEKALTQPLHWRSPRKIFVCAHSDLFHEATHDAWIDRIFAVMALCPQHTFQVLTKRPARMREYLAGVGMGRVYCLIDGNPAGSVSAGWIAGGRPLPNVWFGVTAERQHEADERIPILLSTPAAKRFVSVEPMLEALDLTQVSPNGVQMIDALRGRSTTPDYSGWPALDWVICGGESGKGARPMHPDWVRSLRDQCCAAGVPFLFKQWGEWGPYGPVPGGDFGGEIRRGDVTIVHPSGRATEELADASRGKCTEPGSRYMGRFGKSCSGRLLDGVEHNAFPEA